MIDYVWTITKVNDKQIVLWNEQETVSLTLPLDHVRFTPSMPTQRDLTACSLSTARPDLNSGRMTALSFPGRTELRRCGPESRNSRLKAST